MARKPSGWCFGGVWDATDLVRPHTVPMRQLRAAAKAMGVGRRRVGRKPKMALIFGLAQWGMARRGLPKKSLAKFKDDFQLFNVLQLNGEIRTEPAFYLGDLSSQELLALEKRLHHQWPLVQTVIDALSAQYAPLIAANGNRRKPKLAKLKPVKLTPAALLGV